MKIFQGMATSISALTAEKLRLDTIANNVANINTTRTPEGGPFRRKAVVFEEAMQNQFSVRSAKKTPGSGVRVAEIITDENSPPRIEYDPQHPDADAQGYVVYPNVDLSLELINMMTAQRSYQANGAVFQTSKEMAEKALELGRS